MKKQLLLMLCIGFNAQLYCMEKEEGQKQELTSIYDVFKRSGKEVKICLESGSQLPKEYQGITEIDESIKNINTEKLSDKPTLYSISFRILAGFLKESRVRENDNEIEITIDFLKVNQFLGQIYWLGVVSDQEEVINKFGLSDRLE